MPDPNTMTIDECRDWLMLRKPGIRVNRGAEIGPNGKPCDVWETGEGDEWLPFRSFSGWPVHPIEDTLDAAAAALPDGCSIKVVSHRGNTQATAWPSRLDKLPAVVTFSYDQTVKFIEANSEILARFRLAVACCMADDAAKGER